MKKLFSFGMSWFVLSGSLAFAGPRSDGGGNLMVDLVPEETVRKSLSYAGEDLLVLLGVWVFNDFHKGQIKDPIINEVLKAFMRNGRVEKGKLVDSALGDAIARAKIDMTSQVCKSFHGVSKDASVSRSAIGSTICMSLRPLQRVRQDFLQAQATSLLAHELSHQFGFDERAAVAIQEFVLGRKVDPWSGQIGRISPQVYIRNDDSIGNIKLKGKDARLLYESLNVPAFYSEHNQAFPPGWDKRGEHYSCTKYELPIRSDSEFARELKGRPVIEDFSYDCVIRINAQTGTVNSPW